MIHRMLGIVQGKLCVHYHVNSVGLEPSKDAPTQFQTSIISMAKEWRFENLCMAHSGNIIGGASDQVIALMEKMTPVFKKLSDKR
eukprot:CAMPEP_0182423160 /NCGR_PEP_ID=MMETSP1167-20130531/9064_1 /TAXON_ID=2988 /ORGANISM="Mallomonas Sp, Strain CCMP3275" /LENGTH=84 /DNA_ID=CAMNT_0024601861 /DNA_START=475 /DNA_END=729 /DNA_ORIENTATION=+